MVTKSEVNTSNIMEEKNDITTKQGDVPDQNSIEMQGDRSEEEDDEATSLQVDDSEVHNSSDVRNSRFTQYVTIVQDAVHGFFKKHSVILKKITLIIALLLFIAYFIYAICHSPRKATVVIVLTCLVIVFKAYHTVKSRYGDRVYKILCIPLKEILKQRWCTILKWVIRAGIAAGLIVFIAVDVVPDVKRLTSAGGILLFVILVFLTSTKPAQVKWQPVLWGLGLQFLMGLVILRWSAGYYFFKFLGDQVRIFLDYTDAGATFVFGESKNDHPMAFEVFPIVIYFGAVIGIFYYWGLMQFVVRKIAWMMQFTMGTTAIESLNAATNIFIGMAESCVILRPFLNMLTKSELHAIMTGGFATVSGSYIALLANEGASPEHLLSAAIMSAPAALAMAKLSYPETEVSHTKTEADVFMEKTPARNVVEAASNGAISAVKVVASIAANLIAFLGLIAFLNATLQYLGETVGIPCLSFRDICSYLFWPLATVMGVEMEDAGKVASLIGTKIFVDELISFKNLGTMIRDGNIAERSVVIATYACCGFGSIAAVGVYVGALTAVVPERRGDISEMALRAVINGNVAGFLTACIAGLLYKDGSLSLYSLQTSGLSANDTNSTVPHCPM